tara:strand:- start:199 stop:990 length:792 start_codon:yes stop_codon:yes gene_type:complete
MKVIILAAGEGSRLRPLTLEKPKCLVELFGKSILRWQLDVFDHFNIDEIIIVKGYMEKKIDLSGIKYCTNTNFKTTNMIETLFTAREEMNDSIIVSYGDIIFEKNVLEKLLTDDSDMSVIVDTNWEKYWNERFENPFDDAESLMIDQQGFITSIGQKTQNLTEIQAQYIGLMKFQNDGIKNLKSFYDKSKKTASTGENPLNPKLNFEKSYMTDLLQAMINDNLKIKAIPIQNSWLELDSYNDFKLYAQLYENKRLGEFFNVSN